MRDRHADRIQTETDQSFLAFCREQTRRCPGCGVVIWRDGGCDHLVCVCGTDFMWAEDFLRTAMRGRPDDRVALPFP